MSDRASTNDGVDLHHIGEVADALGLSLRTIRHYEDVGVVVPSGRTAGGFRLYTERDIDRLRKVMGMKPIGFSLDEIRDVLELLDQADDADAPEIVWDRLRIYAALATERRDRYRERLAMAAKFTDRLNTLVRSERSGTVGANDRRSQTSTD